MRKIAITGGGGFLGRYVVQELIDKGYEPLVFDHVSRNYLAGDPRIKSEHFYGDVTSDTAMRELAAHADGIIHLAAVLGTQETVQHPHPAAISNLLGGLNFLEACNQYDLPGSYIAVGNWWFNNTYSITKNMIERFTFMYNNDRNGRVNIVRAVNAYGPHQSVAAPFGSSKVRKITPSFVCRALSGMPIEIYGDGEQVSDMVYVGDVAKALVLALEEAQKRNVLDHTVEVGPREHKTVKEVAELVRDIAAEYCPQQDLKYLPMRPGEKVGDKVTADTDTLKAIGFDESTLVDLETGMRETVKWFLENEGTTWNRPQ